MTTTTTTEPSFIELIDASRERRRITGAAIRRARAELLVLETYDDERRARGHDYGGAQRYTELGRRRRELDHLERGPDVRPVFKDDKPLELDPSADELAAALERIAGPRMARLDRETHRHRSTSTVRSRAAWDRTVAIIDRRVEDLRS